MAASETILTDPIELACRINESGVACYREGRAQEALTLFIRCLRLIENAEGSDSPDLGTVLNNIGAIYEDLCDYSEAEQLYRRALAIAEKAALSEGGADEDLESLRIRSLSNLGQILRIRGCYADAEPLLNRSLALAEQVFGPAHPEVANALMYGCSKRHWFFV